MIPVYNIYYIYDNTTTTLIEVDEKEDARCERLLYPARVNSLKCKKKFKKGNWWQQTLWETKIARQQPHSPPEALLPPPMLKQMWTTLLRVSWREVSAVQMCALQKRKMAVQAGRWRAMANAHAWLGRVVQTAEAHTHVHFQVCATFAVPLSRATAARPFSRPFCPQMHRPRKTKTKKKKKSARRRSPREDSSGAGSVPPFVNACSLTSSSSASSSFFSFSSSSSSCSHRRHRRCRYCLSHKHHAH